MARPILRPRSRIVNGQRADILTGQPYGRGGGFSTPRNQRLERTAPSDPTFFSRLGNNPTRERRDFERGLGRAPREVTLEQIVAQKRQAAQAVADAISASYAPILAKAREEGIRREQTTAAQNRASGLSGSNVADANANTTASENAAVMNSYLAERDAKIASVMAGVEERASDEYRLQREQFLSESRDRMDRIDEFNKRVQDRVVSEIGAIAQSGVGFDEFKTKYAREWDQIVKESGMSEEALKAQYLISKPKATEVFNKTVGNKQIIGYRDPVTNQITTEEIDLPGSGWKFENVGGKPYWVNESTQQIRLVGGGGGTGSGSEEQRGIDSFARRLNAGDIQVSNVPANLRNKVMARAKQFGLLDMQDDIDQLYFGEGALERNELRSKLVDQYPDFSSQEIDRQLDAAERNPRGGTARGRGDESDNQGIFSSLYDYLFRG